MRNEIITIISMLLSGLIVVFLKLTSTKLYNSRYGAAMERFKHLKDLEKNGKISREVVFFEEHPATTENSKVTRNPRKKTRVVLDGKEYTDKNSWFFMDRNILYIIGKKKNIFIEVHSKEFDKEYFERGY